MLDVTESDVNQRNTRQKEAIRSSLVHADRPLSPEELLAFAQKQVEGISMATVYRNLNILVGEKWISPVEIPGESTRYEVAGKGHHHHFKCNDCGKMYDLPGCTIDAKPKLPRGFSVTGHEFFVYGRCAECR